MQQFIASLQKKHLMDPSSFQEKVKANIYQGVQTLFTAGRHCDLAVQVGNSTFSCHSLVLAAVSEFFQTMTNDGNPNGIIHIEDEDVSAEAFAMVLDILYKGTDLVQDIEAAMVMLKCVKSLQIKFLQDHYLEVLRKGITSENCLEIWLFAEKHNLTGLAETATEISRIYFDNVIENMLFLQMPKYFLLSMLSSNLCVKSEDKLLASVFEWINRIKQRRCHLPEFLPFVKFYRLSETYMKLLRSSSFQHDAFTRDYVDETITIELETLKRIHSVEKSMLLSRQDTRSVDSMEILTVSVGASSDPENINTQVVSYPTTSEATETRKLLRSLPYCCGIDFSSCVWRNELYVSGGSNQPTQFAVYNVGINKWSTLPNLPVGREKHAMAAVSWNIYVLGGVTRASGGSKCVSDIMVYGVKTKVWSKTFLMKSPLQELSAAVLGHRIYIFGGRDDKGNATSLVQCVDTLTGYVYKAGQLPSGTYGARAFSNGASVYVVRGEGDLLKMKEIFELADKKEYLFVQSAAVNAGVSEAKASCSGSATRNTVSDPSSNETEGQLVHESSKPEVKKATFATRDTEDKDYENTVHFSHVADINKRRRFGAYIWGDHVTVVGGQTEDGLQLHEILRISKRNGMVTVQNDNVPELSNFELNLLKWPNVPVSVDFKFTFRPDALLDVNTLFVRSHDVLLDLREWCVYVKRKDAGNPEKLEIHIAWNSTWDRVDPVKAKYSISILPLSPASACIHHASEYVFKKWTLMDGGFYLDFTYKDITDSLNGYIKDGEISVYASLTILPNTE